MRSQISETGIPSTRMAGVRPRHTATSARMPTRSTTAALLQGGGFSIQEWGSDTIFFVGSYDGGFGIQRGPYSDLGDGTRSIYANDIQKLGTLNISFAEDIDGSVNRWELDIIVVADRHLHRRTLRHRPRGRRLRHHQGHSRRWQRGVRHSYNHGRPASSQHNSIAGRRHDHHRAGVFSECFHQRFRVHHQRLRCRLARRQRFHCLRYTHIFGGIRHYHNGSPQRVHIGQHQLHDHSRECTRVHQRT